MKLQQDDMERERKGLESEHNAAAIELNKQKSALNRSNMDLKDCQSKLFTAESRISRLEDMEMIHEEHISQIEEYLKGINHHALRYEEGLTKEDRARHEQGDRRLHSYDFHVSKKPAESPLRRLSIRKI